MNEFNDFNEDSYEDDSSYENESDFGSQANANDKLKTYIIVGVVAFVTFLLVFIVTNALVNGGKKKTTPVEPEPEIVYKDYKEGDIVLLNSKKWYVLYNSDKNSEYVTLLSEDDVNDKDVYYGNVNGYLKGTFKQDIMKVLGCESSDIAEIRLLAYIDLATISKANSTEFMPEVLISKYNIPEFIYKYETVTDTVYQTDYSNNPMMICNKDRVSATVKTSDSDDEKDKDTDTSMSDKTVSTTPSSPETNSVESDTQANNNNSKEDTGERFCLGDPTEILPVRPVMVIKKSAYPDGTITSTKSDNTSKEGSSK